MSCPEFNLLFIHCKYHLVTKYKPNFSQHCLQILTVVHIKDDVLAILLPKMEKICLYGHNTVCGCVCAPSFQILNQLTEFHWTLPEHYATAEHLSATLSNLIRSVITMEIVQTCKIGVTLAPFTFVYWNGGNRS